MPGQFACRSAQQPKNAGGPPDWKPVVIVVPCFNERDRLVLSTFDTFAEDHRQIGFVFVDDGSTDGTEDLFRDYGSENLDAFRFLMLDRNRGKGAAVRIGMKEALGWSPTTVGFWDADLSTPLEELSPMVNILEAKPDLHLVIASRVQLLGRRMDRKATRHYLGRVFATGASLTLGMPVYDTQCGAKLFRVTPILRSVLEAEFLSRWIFDVELIGRFAELMGTEDLSWIEEYPLWRWTDVGGSKLRPVDFFLAVWDLIRIWRAKKTP